MDVHNMMEEIVIEKVNDLYKQLMAKKPAWLTCDCDNCKMDAVCYVLNRIPAKYVVSGRGITHTATEISNTQMKADVEAIAIEGIRTVSSVARPYHNESSESKSQTISGPAFNFPTFIGSVIDGSTFEPISNASVLLKIDGNVAKMNDITWSNPCKTYNSTKGAYSLWVAPLEASKADETRKFSFSLEISADGYDPIVYAFDLPVTSDSHNINHINSTFSLKIKDLYLFKKEIQNSME